MCVCVCVQVTVPQRLFDHRDDFARPIWKEKYANSSLHYLPDLSLLTYLHSHIDQDLAELLHPLVTACESAVSRRLPLPVKVTSQREEQRFGYRFPGTENRRTETAEEGGSTGGSEAIVTSQKSLHRRFSRQHSSQTDVSESLETSQISQSMKKRYTFTPEILTFVTHQNPLLAALIHLLSPPPPSPPSLSTLSTSSQKKTGKSGSEEDGTTGLGTGGGSGTGEGEEREEGGVRRMAVFGVRSRVKSQLARRTSYDHHAPLSPSPSSSWTRDLDDVLVQFVAHQPMQQFLQARLAPFNPVLPWDPPGATPTGRGRRSSAHPEPRDSLRVLALLPSRGHALGSAVSYTLHRFIEIGRVSDAVCFLVSEPASCHGNRTRLLKDVALSSAFVDSYSETLSLGQSGETATESLSLTPSPTSSPLSLISQISDPELAARLVLSSLHNWPVETCRNLLSFSSHHLPPSSPLLPIVREKLEKIEIYAIIMAKCKTLLFMKSGRERRKEERSWGQWTQLARDSENKPQYVLDLLLTEREFELTRRWAHIHHLSQSVTQVCACVSE